MIKNPKIISGTDLAQTILANIRQQITQIPTNTRIPTLAVILVGNNPASQIYVQHKQKVCNEVGITALDHKMPEHTTQAELEALITSLNQDPNIDGILVQLPLPKHLNSTAIIDAINPLKDVDGFHRYNIGSLAINSPKLSPCTPHGIMYMLDSLQLDYSNKHAVVLGKSNIVGRPMLLELINRGATVTICNSKTPNLPAISKTADIVIAAVGKPLLIKRDWIKPGAIVIDVGVNHMPNGKLCGDVDFDNVIDLVGHITQVPGGVGPMTIAMLIKNTLECYLTNVSK